MKKCIACLTAIMVFLSVFSGTVWSSAEGAAVQTTGTAPVTINDNEMGWYGLDDYALTSIGQFDTVRTETARVKAEDTDAVSILWLQHINDSVRPDVKEMLLYKDLAAPVTGGSFSFYYFLANHYASGSFGLEAIAYDKAGNAYSLGKPFDNSGLLWSVGDGNVVNPDPVLSGGWNHYTGVMPAEVAVYKMAIRVYVRANHTPEAPLYASIPNPSWPDQYYSFVDQIEFIDTQYADSIIPLGTMGWTPSSNFGVTTAAYTPATSNVCVDGAASVRLYNLGTGAEITSSMTKLFAEPLQAGTFTFKVYSIFNNYGGDPRYYKARAYAIDRNGKEVLLGGSGAETFRFSGNMVTQTYNGWNAFVVDIPEHLVYKGVKIEIYDANGFQSGDSQFYIDGMNLVGAKENPIIINDSELGWYGTEEYYVGGNLMDYTRIVPGPTPTPTANASVRNAADDADNRAFTWLQYINHTVRPQTDMFLYKDLTEPVTGGSFSFYYWLSNFYSANGFGLEAIAYDENGNDYSLGKPFDNSGVKWSIADGNVVNPDASLSYGWTHYEGVMPEGVAVYKVAIRVYLRAGRAESIPSAGWPDQSFSIIDQIEFVGCEYAFESVDLGKNNWTAGENCAILSNTTATIATLDGESSLQLGNAPDTQLTTYSMTKMLDEPRQGGIFSFKAFSGFLNPADPRWYMAKAYAIDLNGNRVYVGGSPEETAMKFSGSSPTGQMFYGWNYFLCDIPDTLVYQGIVIEFYDFAQYPSGDTKLYVAETLLLDSEIYDGPQELVLVENSVLEDKLFEDAGVKYLDLATTQSMGDLLAEFEGADYVNLDGIGTGHVIQLLVGGVVVDEILIVVRGDIDGDGKLAVNDMVYVKKHMVESIELTGAYYYAACVTGGAEPGAPDIVSVKRQMLGLD